MDWPRGRCRRRRPLPASLSLLPLFPVPLLYTLAISVCIGALHVEMRLCRWSEAAVVGVEFNSCLFCLLIAENENSVATPGICIWMSEKMLDAHCLFFTWYYWGWELLRVRTSLEGIFTAYNRFSRAPHIWLKSIFRIALTRVAWMLVIFQREHLVFSYCWSWNLVNIQKPHIELDLHLLSEIGFDWKQPKRGLSTQNIRSKWSKQLHPHDDGNTATANEWHWRQHWCL